MASKSPETEDAAGLSDWLRLTLIPGIGGESQRKLLAAFGLPHHVFAAGHLAQRQIIASKADLLTEAHSAALNEKIAAALIWAEKPDCHLITLVDKRYPPQLLEIPDPPTLLYVRGNPAALSRPGIAMVGSRNATPQGCKVAEDFARTLADSGFAIISGLALGIDAAAHSGALTSRTRQAENTIAVIGTGADRLYPARNQALAQRIVEHGAIVSEFPLGTPAIAANFPRRNRVISGLARGVLVVEAATESGSLITARLAGEQGREVFAIPGSIHSPFSKGCHRLIRQGAKLVESAQDILEELTGAYPAAPTPVPLSAPDAVATGAESRVLAQLGHDVCTLDELALRTALPADALLALLLNLELEGQIAPLPGNRYQRIYGKK
ncbi:MAG: DNA-processing protein DprA [Zoogloeaceae bacterium]|jgi:DNA processing protein|nr:DNA-processing protein DprA [Zoogloeaceae bacterium]